MLVSVLFNALDPLANLLFFELFKTLAQGVVKLLDIFELFTLLDGCAK